MHSRQEGTVKWFDEKRGDWGYQRRSECGVIEGGTGVIRTSERGARLLGVQCGQGTSLACQAQSPASLLPQVLHRARRQ